MKSFYFIVFTFLFTTMLFSQNQLPIIPYPVSVKIDSGKFILNEQTVISTSDNEQYSNAEILNDWLQKMYNVNLKIEMNSSEKDNCIYLKTIYREDESFESYNLTISSNMVVLEGGQLGAFYGIQTLKQLINKDQNGLLNIPAATIYDEPRYSWRGMHLDVSRHFFTVDEIKKYLDYLSLYKMNVFHWHLTDDQGWRIEIKKYPKLTEVGAWRNATLIGPWRVFPHRYDSTRYGGYYTQQDIKEIVRYALERHIMIVPEIEMPGHCLAALASYPEYSCTGGPFDVASEWGIYDDVFCPTEETFKFLEDVLTEVSELFPGKYIHIGGDEVPKEKWKESKYCQDLMKREGLKDENELQSYFTQRIEKFLNSKDKTIIGWDEILEGGLAPNAVVMSWRGERGGIEAARQNHDVVMSPGAYCYFDHYQGNPKFEPLAIGGYTTVEKVYSYEPTPDSLTLNEQDHILGAQGNVWTEYIPNFKQIEYMVFPRICALAEVLWTPGEKRNYEEYQTRLIEHFKLLDKLGINYSKSIYQLKTDVLFNEGYIGVDFKLSSNFNIGKIYYSTDGSEPSINSLLYKNPINIPKDMLVKAAYFEDNVVKSGVMEQQFYVNKATGKNITLQNEPDKRYNYGGALTLVDGIKGILPWYGKEWLGFSGTDCEATIDFGKSESFSKVFIDVLDDNISWIWLPTKVELYISDDGKEYKKIKEVSADEITKMKREVIINVGNISARYVKIIAKNYGKIPAGNPGEGHNAWLFVDELGVE